MISPDQLVHSVVILGDFNPRIFQPAWFAAQRLLGEQESEKASINIIHRDIVIFSLDWLRLEVTKDRFVVISEQQPYFKPLRDLVLGTFTILTHTPLTALGMNLYVHSPISDQKHWRTLQRQLAPEQPWKPLLNEPELGSLTMLGGRSDKRAGRVGVRLEPSQKVKPGVFVEVNDHYEVTDSGKVVGGEAIMNIVQECWAESQERCQHIINTLVNKVPSRAG